jgi:hypothetical protein
VGGDLVEEAVPGRHRLDEQGLEALELIFECGKSQEFYDVHFLQTIGQDADDRKKGAEKPPGGGASCTDACRLRLVPEPRMEAVECSNDLQTELEEFLY